MLTTCLIMWPDRFTVRITVRLIKIHLCLFVRPCQYCDITTSLMMNDSSHWCINGVGAEFTCSWPQYDLLIETGCLPPVRPSLCVCLSSTVTTNDTMYLLQPHGNILITCYHPHWSDYFSSIWLFWLLCVWRIPHLDPASSSSGSILRAWRTLML